MPLDFDNGIKYPERMRQNKDFRNLKLNGFTPTDIDAAYELKERVYIFIELKQKGQTVPQGQMRMLMSLVNSLTTLGKHCLFAVAEHDTMPEQDIDVGNCEVVEMYYSKDGKVVCKRDINKTLYAICSGWINKHG